MAEDTADKEQAPEEVKKDEPTEDSSKTTEPTTDDSESKQSFIDKLKALPPKKKKLYGGLVGLLALLVVLWFVPATKYAALNIVSEADASVTIVDSETGQPISGAEVRLSGGEVATTDADGVAFFNDANYGSTTATITKDAYETLTVNVTISRDDIVFGPFDVVSTGVPVVVTAQDWLNGTPVANFTVEDAAGESIFNSVDGSATLNIPTSAEATASYTVKAEGYNDSVLSLDVSGAATGVIPAPEPAQLVRSGKHSFLSNRDGDINFYASDFDGSNVEKLVETGEDGTYFNFLSIPGSEDTYVALLSSGNGSDLDQLAFVDLSAKTIEVVDEAEGIDLSFSFITTDEERVLYNVYFDDDRELDRKVKSYDYASGKLTTIAEAPSYINASYDPDTNIVITQITNYQASPTRYELAKRVLPDGDKQVLTNVQTNGPYYPANREPGTFVYFLGTNPSHERGYYEMTFDGNFPGKYLGEDWPEYEERDEVPDSEKGLESPEGTNRAWIETRDGKGRLIVNESTNVVNKTGVLSVFSIIRWVDETTITITGSDGTETADYIMDVESGNYKKITNTFRQSYGRGYGGGF